jgi:D-glycero-D-manno-heptose 1,7-bisphosphate phosphatase
MRSDPGRDMRRTKAAFLDRDGVVIRDVHHLHSVRDLRLLPGVAQAIRSLNSLGYLVIFISNQAAVAKGLLTETGLDRINKVLIKRLTRHGAHVDGQYYCPHHPNGTIPRYTIRCACRKPGTKMIRDAMRAFNIDRAQSYMIGDKTQDILTGKRARLTTILVETGYGGRDGLYVVEPDHRAKDIAEAVRIISRSSHHHTRS